MTDSNDTRPSKLAKLQRAAAWIRDTGLGTAGVVFLVFVTAAGWTGSTLGLMDFAVRHMGYDGWKRMVVPATFDGAAIGLTIVAFRAAINGRSALFARVGVIGFAALSMWINYTHIDDPVGKPIGALLPLAAVILLESLVAEARRAHETRTGRPRPRIHPLRWVFDRPGTVEILRAYVLGLPMPEQYQVAAATVVEQKAAEQAEADAARSKRRRPKTTPTPTPAPPVAAPATVVEQPPARDDTPTEVIKPVTEEPAVESGRHAKVADVITLADDDTAPAWLTDDMTAQEAMARYLGDHPKTPGTKLARLARMWGYEASDSYGRQVKRKAAEKGEQRAAGE